MFAQTIIAGRAGQDAEMRYTPSGQAVTNFSVATSESWTDQSGQRQERTTWYRVEVWQRLAEICNQYVRKGHLVLVTGKMKEPRVWTGQDGQARCQLEMRAVNVQFMTSRAEAEQMAASQGYNPNAGASPAGGNTAPAEAEEDIPF